MVFLGICRSAWTTVLSLSSLGIRMLLLVKFINLLLVAMKYQVVVHSNFVVKILIQCWVWLMLWLLYLSHSWLNFGWRIALLFLIIWISLSPTLGNSKLLQEVILVEVQDLLDQIFLLRPLSFMLALRGLSLWLLKLIKVVEILDVLCTLLH